MFLMKPEFAHKEAVKAFYEKAKESGDKAPEILGGSVLAERFIDGGYDAWLKQVQANALAHEWHSSCGLEPGNTLLLVENVSGHEDASEEYLSQFPAISEDLRLVGIVTFRAVMEDVDNQHGLGVCGASAECRSPGSAILSLCIIPCYRDTINYILAFTDAMTYAVCKGFPYKYLVYWSPDNATRGVVATALKSCNFDYKSTDSATNEDVYWADLRTAHQLRDRVCEFNRKE